MMKKSSLILALSIMVQALWPVHAYELSTHAAVTEKAYERSNLAVDPGLFNKLGVDATNLKVFGETYFDVSGNEIRALDQNKFEQGRMPNKGVDFLTIKGWLMRGAIREDDYQKKSIPCKTNPPNPPNGEALDRPINHFYDPINNQSLGFGAEKAFDWGLGTQNALTNGNVEDPGRDNHYSVFDAREAMYRALTERNKAGSKAIGVGGSTPSNAADKEAMRKAYWATTFRALGDLVHLIQDMAQPQHTRSDPHLTECPDIVQAVLGGKSLYEDYVDKRATGSLFAVKGGAEIALPPLVYTDAVNPYPIPQFNDYVSYFTTRHLESGLDDGSVLSRRGLADYSNRSFFTVRTNFNPSSPRYALPTNNFPAYGTKIETTDWTGMPLSGDGVILLTHQVTDSVDANQTRPAVPLTTFSVWDSWLQDRGFFKRYSLNRFNYDAMADLLVPRAVAYSAGLIDYFFRGRMEILLPDDGVYAILDHAVEKNLGDGFRKIKFKLYNSTPAINDGQNEYPQAMTGGTLRAVVKFQRNGCYQHDLSGEAGVVTGCNVDTSRGPEEIVISDAMTIQEELGTLPAQAREFVFDYAATPIPVNAVNVSLQVVYRGTLGSETDAVVVATKDVAEPTFIEFMNNTDYHMVDGVYYRPDEIRNTPQLMERVSNDSDLDPVDVASSFNFGLRNVGYTEISSSGFARFAVLAEKPALVVNVLSHTLGGWSLLNVPLNRHEYVVQTGKYFINQLHPVRNATRGTYHHFILIDRKRSGSPNPFPDYTSLDNLDNLEPQAIQINF